MLKSLKNFFKIFLKNKILDLSRIMEENVWKNYYPFLVGTCRENYYKAKQRREFLQKIYYKLYAKNDKEK